MSGLTPEEREKAREDDETLAGTADGFRFDPGLGGGAERTDNFSGAGIADTIVLLNKGIEEDNEAVMAAAGVALVFDTVGLVLNPFGSLLAAGAGWLIDHIFFLREPLDLLMGDNLAVNAQTKRMKAEAEEYTQRIAPDFLAAVGTVKGWEGPAADKFRADMAKVGDELAAIGEAITGLAKIMGKMSACVTAFRSAVRDIIALTLGGLAAGAIAAMAMMPFTFGTSIAVFVVTAVGVALSALSKIMNLLSKLGTLLSKNGTNASKVGGQLSNVAAAGTRQNRSVTTVASKAGPTPAKAPGTPPPRTNSPTNPSSAPPPPASRPPTPPPTPPAQAKPPAPPKPKPVNPTKDQMKLLTIKQRMNALEGVTDQALARTLMDKFGKSPSEAYHMVRILRNIERVAAPNGVVRAGPHSFPVGNFVHAAHELSKEFAGLSGG